MDSVENRRGAIVALINEKGEVTFAQLKEAFPNVSDMTLRTDLKNLDDSKRIVRVHGGARSVDVVVGTDDFMSRRSIRNVDAKKAIKKAFTLQLENKGFSFIELLGNCPTNWGLTPLQTLDYMNTNTIPYFKPGVYKDVTKKEAE